MSVKENDITRVVPFICEFGATKNKLDAFVLKFNEHENGITNAQNISHVLIQSMKENR